MDLPKKLGKYNILNKIGHGGFATVYRAFDEGMGRNVALKLIKAGHLPDPTHINRFQREAQKTAQLRHPHIVPVYDFGTNDDMFFLVMALIEGPSLRDLLIKHKHLPLNQALPILRQLAQALDYMHHQQFVHRDLKPANVLLEGEEQNWQVTLVDFGLARSLETTIHLTRTGYMLGTPNYMSPEQVDEAQWGPITSLTDIYALGVITYEILVGHPPFKGETPLTILRAHADKPPRPPLDLAPDLGEDIANILLKALAKDPNNRYARATQLVAALEEVAQNRTKEVNKSIELNRLLEFAQQARRKGDWLTVQQFCVQIMQLDRTHPEALIMMTEAMMGLQRENAAEAARQSQSKQYEAGEAALHNKQWTEAIAAFEVVVASNPDFREVQQKLQQAKDELKWATWYGEAINLTNNKTWFEACKIWLKLLNQQPNYHQGEALSHLLTALSGLLTAHSNLTAQLKISSIFSRSQLNFKQNPNNSIINIKDGKEMVHIPSGKFLYGDNKEAKTLAEFWIDKHPVTNKEFSLFTEETNYKTTAQKEGKSCTWSKKGGWNWVKGSNWQHPNGPNSTIKHKMNHPVVQVSWYDALAYAKWAGKQLPTQEQWEKAARGTEGYQYPWGNTNPTNTLCNFGEQIGDTTPTGHYSPQGDSPYNCVDMSGNTWEWTLSNYEETDKILRGGSWFDQKEEVRTTYTIHFPPDNRFNFIGFRCITYQSAN